MWPIRKEDHSMAGEMVKWIFTLVEAAIDRTAHMVHVISPTTVLFPPFLLHLPLEHVGMRSCNLELAYILIIIWSNDNVLLRTRYKSRTSQCRITLKLGDVWP